MKKFFETPRKAAITTICIAAPVILAAGIVFAAVNMSRFYSGGKKITLERAKEIALADAGVSASEVTFTKEKQEWERSMLVYEVKFYTEKSQYEYEINGNAGTIYSKSKETFAAQSGDVSERDVSSQEKLDQNRLAADQDASDLTPVPEDGEIADGAGTSQAEIGVEQAREIAAVHAGFSAAEVNFSKSKLEHEHGTMVYEIEFYKDGMEYEYEIDAATGEIVKFDSEWDD